jgi:hypothetical protein
MSRHVAHIEGHGRATPERVARQRKILSAVAREYRPLPDKPPEYRQPIEAFAFSKKTSASEAVARLVGILDAVDAEWRDYVRVWDGWGRDGGALSDPPRSGWLGVLRDLVGW